MTHRKYDGLGYGNVPGPDDSVIVAPPTPPGKGYGRGYSPYGSGLLPRSPFPPEKGFGADAYGTSPYGHPDITPPRLVSAVSESGTSVVLTFSEHVVLDLHLLQPETWTFISDYGASPVVEAVHALDSAVDPTDSSRLIASQLQLKHTGTVLGGRYQVVCGQGGLDEDPFYFQDRAGNRALESCNKVSFLALGETVHFTVEPLLGNKLKVTFDTPMGEGYEDPYSYAIKNTSYYPVTPYITEVIRTRKQTESRIYLQAAGLTSLDYELICGPSGGLDYHPADGMPTTGAYELGVGYSAVQPAQGEWPALLRMTKEAGSPYGWYFTETEGDALVAGSVFRFDLYMAASMAVWNPAPVNGNVMGVHLSDGDVQVSLLFGRQSGSDTLTIVSGALNVSISFDWSSSWKRVSLIRNQLTKHWSILDDGHPVFSFDLAQATGAPTMPEPGVQIVLASNVKVSDMVVFGIQLNASNTLYTKAGNFVFGDVGGFLGLGDLALQSLKTKRGPLTKGWGDSRPATSEDVAVRVNGVEVSVANVNPYVGEIQLDVPIPRMAADKLSVEVDYQWFPTPRMSMDGLNTLGLVLNKWDVRSGRNSSSATLSDGGGSKEGERFPMCLALGKAPEWNPKWVSHRHIGFDRAYTAALNEPTSLVLNANPHLFSPPRKSVTLTALSGRYDGTRLGSWAVSGDISFDHDAEPGYGSVTSSEPWSTAHPVALALSPGVVSVSARVIASALTDSAFAVGPVIAFHDNDHLKCAAALTVNGVEHFAILEGEDPTEVSSWRLGPSAQVSLTAQMTMKVPAGKTPPLFAEGKRLQILKGLQAGIYTCTAKSDLSDGSVQLTVTPDFPVDVDTWEAGDAEVFFETRWSSIPFTWGLTASSDAPGISLSFSADIAHDFGSSLEGPPSDSIPDTLLDRSGYGQVLWGTPLLFTGESHVSRWGFVNFSAIPHHQRRSSVGHTVTAELSDLPDESGKWWRNSSIGTAQVLGNGSVRIRAEAQPHVGESAVGYDRVDPLIPGRSVVEVQAKFLVEGQGSGWGDAGFIVKGPTRDARVSTLLYSTSNGGHQLLDMPACTLAGDADVSARGWSIVGTPTCNPEGRTLRLTSSGPDFSLSKSLVLKGNGMNGVSRMMEARLSLSSQSADGDVGLALAMQAGSPARFIALTFLNSPKRVALSSGEGTLLEVPCDWETEHHYRVIAEHVADPYVALHIDGEMKGSVNLLDFAPGSDATQVSVLGYGGAAWEAELSAYSVSVLPPKGARRTIGIYKGGDPSNIDSWEVPRKDAYKNALKNSRNQAKIVEMDWRKPVHLRLTIDPTWGISLYRPDLGLPAGYSETKRASEFTNPSAAWCSLEWQNVPLHRDPYTRFTFGSLRGGSVSTVDWDFFKYRVFIGKDEGVPVLRNAVLNRWNILTSGELGQDLTVDEVRVPVSGNVIHLRKGHINARRVFHVHVDGTHLSRDDWSFSHDHQTITLMSPVTGTATVKFSPGDVVTNTYLEAQPIEDGVTNLNEGTPPMSWTRSRPWKRGFLPASRINEMSDTLNIDDDFVLNDPLGLVTFGNHPADLYADVSFMEIEDDGSLGRITSIDDGPAPGQGVAGLEIEGRLVHDKARSTLRPDFDQRGGAMGGLLHLGGGGYAHTGVIGGGQDQQGAVMFPSAPSAPEAPNPGAAELQAKWDVREARTEELPQPSESGSYVMQNGGPYSRFGPWGGLASLETQSFLYGGTLPSGGVGMMLQGGKPLPPPDWSLGDLSD